MLLKNQNLYYVGGVVRDELLNVKSIDTDLCYEGDAIVFAKTSGLNIVKENPSFGTVRVKMGESDVDIASTRTETYPKKGHLPVVADIGCALKADLKRRDFTINAMAKRTTDLEIVDYFNGINDIQDKKIKVLHKDSFIDDPTRIIRALKFAVRFGFELSDETFELQNLYLKNINYDMSYHRLKKELIEAFGLENPEVYDRFIKQKIYRLLGEDIKVPEISGSTIKTIVNKFPKAQNKWFLYLSPILGINENINIPLTRAEKRILEYAQKLKKQPKSNNTPYESLVVYELLNN